MIENANKVLLKSPTELQYSVREIPQKIVVKVIRKSPDYLINEITSINKFDCDLNAWNSVGAIIDKKV